MSCCDFTLWIYFLKVLLSNHHCSSSKGKLLKMLHQAKVVHQHFWETRPWSTESVTPQTAVLPRGLNGHCWKIVFGPLCASCTCPLNPRGRLPFINICGLPPLATDWAGPLLCHEASQTTPHPPHTHPLTEAWSGQWPRCLSYFDME